MDGDERGNGGAAREAGAAGRGADALRLAWSRHDGAGAEPKQGLSLDRIVAAAIDIADADGLSAVSMSRVAKALGFTTMSLYRHVRSKDELILLMQDDAVGPPPTVLLEPPAARVAGVPEWRIRLERWTWEVLGAFRRHPWLLQTIALFGPPATPNQLGWLEQGLRSLAGTGLPEDEKLSTILMLDAQVFSDLQFEASGTAAEGSEGFDAAGDYGATLTAVLDPARFPAVLAAVRGGALEGSGDDAADRDVTFAFGLARILDGLQVLIDARAADAATERPADGAVPATDG